jgi:hypothetical protein
MHRRLWLGGGLVAALVLLAAGAGAVMAQSGDDGDGSFLERVAARLGIDADQLEQAIRDTRNEDVDSAVESGDLTEEQAERLKERLDEKPALREPRFGFPGPAFDFEFKRGEGPPLPFFEDRGKGHGWFRFGLGLLESVEELADFLGISQQQLVEELMAEDASLASVAEAHGKSRDELKAFIGAEADEKLVEAVEAELLTQERADEIRENLDEALDKIVDMQFGFPWKRFNFDFDFRFHGEDEDAPGDASPAPQGGASDDIQRS